MLNLNRFMNDGIKSLLEIAGRFYLDNRRGQAFMLHMASALRKGAKRRDRHEQNGVHIPPFLIASIASSCNLRCAGCYARANGGCGQEAPQAEMGTGDWRRVFAEASEAGVSFILLAGGEPLMRRDVVEMAAEFDSILFPVFTNGTLVDGEYLDLFDRHRNLIPVLSIEGDEAETDRRRGMGVSERVRQTARSLQSRGILFGASITVTSENMEAVTESAFLGGLREQGCGLVFFVEYVPAEKNTERLVLSADALKALAARVEALREEKGGKGMILLSFPGDEEAMGGCLAAGRGFFHINAKGGAEPCPFSPYSEMNVREQSLLTVLQSPFFEKVRQISAAEAVNHHGGCTLFEHEGEVAQALH